MSGATNSWIRRWNRWQWVWLVLSACWLFASVSYMNMVWPRDRNTALIADLQDPACQSWRELPDGYRPDSGLTAGEPCQAIKLFITVYGEVLRSVEDYDRWFFGLKVKAVFYTALLWLIPVSVLYGGGWLAGRLIRKLRAEPAGG